MLSGLILIVTASCLDAGDIEGKVVISRSLTKRRVVVDLYAPRGGAPAYAPAPADLDEWGRTVIYIDAVLPIASPQPIGQIPQRNRRFEREVLIVPVGSAVSFPNTDPIFHNVFSLSKAKSFDLGYYSQGQTRVIRFDNPGPVQIFCHLHPNMNAAVLVVPNLYFAQPSATGDFRIPAVPAGRYMLRLWHKSAGFLQEEIDVPADASVQVVFNLPLAAAKP